MKTSWFATSALILALSTPSVDAIALSQTEAPQPVDLWEFNAALNLAETEAGPPPQGDIVLDVKNWAVALDDIFTHARRIADGPDCIKGAGYER